MGFPTTATAVASMAAGAAGFGAAYAYQHGYAETLGQLDGTPAELDHALHYHDAAARTAMMGVTGLGGCIAWAGVQVDGPGAIVIGIGLMAAAAGAQLGWALGGRLPAPS